MMILHVYNVSCAQRSTGKIWNETVVAMNTAEARDALLKANNLPDAPNYLPYQESDWHDLVWHVHELTRFNA